ncbi:MAG: enoyl-CoA hydratase/isomerase family protein [Pseudonocardiales bacterium]|nr:enoyl-CoA hydratase/isomerase family protein [Pseudonocardiales bacterium]MBV9031177.1 enoyl-CoA hydratase/isomerase family protein [Pseudonocardiales bacterium]MBW0011267.1 enoyl-CoA hydratase/isomerase family protein [Pseudonocardiales bacterium]
MTESIRWDRDADGGDGIVTLVLDDPGRSANTMNDRYVASMGQTLDRLEAERDSITGVIVTSAKKTFFAGADLNTLRNVTPEDAREFGAHIALVKGQLRRLEKLGRPVVAAINGAALGGGLEIALACHHRIALDAPGSKIGFPEVTLGILPGLGGVVRTVRMLGLVSALTQLLLQGQQLRPAQAKEVGIIDEVAATPEEMLGRAREWIAAHPRARQPWDDGTGYRIPGGTPSTPALAQLLPAFPATLRKQLKGASMPAPHHILCAAVEGSQVDVDTALLIESRYFMDLVTGQVAKNMIKAFFFDLQHINKGGSRPDGYPRRTFGRVGVLGAGMMGAGIAYSCARAGMDVVLKDVDLATAQRGKGYSVGLLDKAVARGRSTAQAREEVLARITPTADAADLRGCDLVIEAVFEDPALKKKVFAEILDVVGPDALLCSNTSTLPITDLASATDRPAEFLGLHFFSPVDRMPLVEIVRGRQTSDAALAAAVDVVQQIRKTPIVVNDSRGFFTSRVIGTFINEGVAMLAEGAAPASIEQATVQAGYPVPVLQLVDELTLTLTRRIRDETRRGVEAAGGTWTPHPADAIVDRMVLELQRPGRSGGAGFYEYEAGRRTRLWPGLAEQFGPWRPDAVPFGDMKERMLVVEALETVKCLDEGVITSVPDANIGSIMGIGFPPWTGGVVQFMNGYPGGLTGFVARAKELADRYGGRFTPPSSLIAKADAGESFD